MLRPLCECGCGKRASLVKKTNRRLGHVKGQPLRFVSGHERSANGKKMGALHGSARFAPWRLQMKADALQRWIARGMPWKQLKINWQYTRAELKGLARKRYEVKRAQKVAEAKLRWENTVIECKCCRVGFTPRWGTRKIGNKCYVCRSIGDRVRRFGVCFETVNPFSVFERDEWRCQHCGCETPKNARGTGWPNEPTLDHVLPMSLDGAHSYANTQCLCRRCNTAKLDRVEREPRLKNVTDLTPFTMAKYSPTDRRDKTPCKCACGCDETIIPFTRGNSGDYKAGHWRRVQMQCTHLPLVDWHGHKSSPNFDAEVVALFKGGHSIRSIAVIQGYVAGMGCNRVRGALYRAGLWKPLNQRTPENALETTNTNPDTTTPGYTTTPYDNPMLLAAT